MNGDGLVPEFRHGYCGHMQAKAAVAELKAHLSRYLRRVKAGEEVIITERNLPIARIVPLAPSPSGRAQLAALADAGIVRIGKGGLPRDFWRRRRPRDEDALLRRAVDEERDENW